MFKFSRWLLGVAVFAGVLIGGTWALQDSLLVFEAYGPYVHWAMVLLVLPMAAGMLLRMLMVPGRLLALLTGAALAAGTLYELYRTQFWAQPPGPAELAVYFVLVSGLSHITAYPVADTFRVFWRFLLFALPGNYQVNRPGNKGNAEGGKSSGGQVPNVPISDFGLNVVNGLVGLLSLLISVFSIFFMGQGS